MTELMKSVWVFLNKTHTVQIPYVWIIGILVLKLITVAFSHYRRLRLKADPQQKINNLCKLNEFIFDLQAVADRPDPFHSIQIGQSTLFVERSIKDPKILHISYYGWGLGDDSPNRNSNLGLIRVMVNKQYRDPVYFSIDDNVYSYEGEFKTNYDAFCSSRFSTYSHPEKTFRLLLSGAGISA